MSQVPPGWDNPRSDQDAGTRSTSFFRGAELSRLLIMLAIVVGGWTIFAFWSGSRQAPAPPPTPLAEIPPLPPADDSIEFQGVVDKTPMRLKDNAAYVALLERTRQTAAGDLAKKSRHDVLFTQLAEDPQRYRGIPLHVEGVAGRIMADEVGKSFSPSGRLFEAWVFTEEAQRYPYVLVFEDAPKGMPGGSRVSENITFDGYFLKLKAYQNGRGEFWAPMLVGRIHWIPEKEAKSWHETSTFKYALYISLTIMAILTTYRWTVMIRRRLFGPSLAETIPRASLSHSEIEPGELTSWIESHADVHEIEEDGEEEPSR